MNTSSFNNPLINFLNDYSSVYYSSFNRNYQNSHAKRWTKDDNHYNSKRCTHCGRRGHTIDKCHRLHGFPPNYKRRKFFVNNVTAIKKKNESETLTNQKESQQSSSFCLNKEQYNSLLTLLQQSQLAAIPSTEHHRISNTSTGIICHLKSLPKSVLWILDSSATDHISSSLDNFTTYRIIPYVPIKLPNGTTIMQTLKALSYFVLHSFCIMYYTYQDLTSISFQ